MRGMGVFFCIAVAVVHSMHNAISFRHQERRALHKPGCEINNTLPVFAGRIHLVGCIPVQKERMKEQRKEPMGNKKH
jgi:hypothetical protein